MIIIMIIIIIIIIIIITITITIVSLKIWEVFLQFCILLPYRHLYKKEEYRSECSSHHVLTPLICGEDPGQNYLEGIQDKHRGSSTRKPLCMVLGLVASQRTGFSELTGEGNRAKSTLLNTPLTLLFSYFTSLITTSWRTSCVTYSFAYFTSLITTSWRTGCVTYSFARPDNSIFGGNNNPKY